MKRQSTLFIAFSLCGMMTLQASKDLQHDMDSTNSISQPDKLEIVSNPACTTKYIMLNPLDTTKLPHIPIKQYGGQLVRDAFNNDMIWEQTKKDLRRNKFSDKSIYHMMCKMYRNTNQHYVSIPVAYWSYTPSGDSLLVSGKIYLPKCRELKGIVIANHYTIASDIEAPSNAISMESIFTLKDYAVIMPDYIGYGLTREKIHPYLHWRSAAQSAVDLLDCMPKILDYYNYSYPTDVVIEGYSQGASVALGVTRMIEENNQIANQEGEDINWTVRKLYAGAGPYDPAATYMYSITENSTGIPAAIPLIIIGLNEAYNLGLEMKDFFQEPLLSHYKEWVLSKEYTVQEISFLMGSTIISELMTPEAIDPNLTSTKLLYDALNMNSNVGYNLQSPAYFMHSLDDQVVPLVNSYNLQSHLPDTSQVFFDYGHYGSHMEASVPFLQYVYQNL